MIIRQKLKDMFIVPNVSLPNVRAIRKLKANGTKPTNASARPVWNEFLIRRLLSAALTFSSIKV